jgi:hypothetical protein
MDTTPHIAIRLVTTAERARHGWPLDSCFVEQFWLPILGPSSIALLRWLARHADDLTRYHHLPLTELASTIGLGSAVGRHSPIRRTLERLTRFDAARWDTTPDADTPELSVYSHLLPVPRRLATQLPTASQNDHDRAVSALAAASA